jgi:hypothetical protein
MVETHALPMQENNSINFEDNANVPKRYVVKRDGK